MNLPPLDKVWLSDPKQCDHKNALQRQWRVTQRREEIKSKEFNQKLKHYSLPQLAKSDIESDDESKSWSSWR